jgi:DNA-3-methyladenine glycosylase II
MGKRIRFSMERDRPIVDALQLPRAGWDEGLRPDLLTDATLHHALAELTACDPRLTRIVADYGPPPLWAREPGFPTRVHIILEQQVSLASAKAAFDRLLALASPLTPERFLELDDATLKAAGFSRQKTRYGRALAAAVKSVASAPGSTQSLQ